MYVCYCMNDCHTPSTGNKPCLFLSVPSALVSGGPLITTVNTLNHIYMYTDVDI